MDLVLLQTVWNERLMHSNLDKTNCSGFFVSIAFLPYHITFSNETEGFFYHQYLIKILVNHVDFWDLDFQVYLDLAKIIDSLL